MKSFRDIIPKSLVKVDLTNCSLPATCTFKSHRGLDKSSELDRLVSEFSMVATEAITCFKDTEISEVLELYVTPLKANLHS